MTDCPTVGDDGDGAPIEIVETELTLTVTVAVWSPGRRSIRCRRRLSAAAVTFDVLSVVSVVCAFPFASVLTTAALSEPLSVVNVTGTPGSKLPFVSRTLAANVLEPPNVETGPGLPPR